MLLVRLHSISNIRLLSVGPLLAFFGELFNNLHFGFTDTPNIRQIGATYFCQLRDAYFLVL